MSTLKIKKGDLVRVIAGKDKDREGKVTSVDAKNHKVMNGPEAEVRVGNCLPLEITPVGTPIHNIELYPGRGGQLVRTAGVSAQLMAKEG